KVIQGVEATQYLIRLGRYQRELWIGSPKAIPPQLFGMMNAADDRLSKLRGFPLVDHAELPYGKSKLLVDHSVVKIEQRNVPPSARRMSVPCFTRNPTTPSITFAFCGIVLMSSETGGGCRPASAKRISIIRASSPSAPPSVLDRPGMSIASASTAMIFSRDR